jgi:DNA-binding transcriptional LysR family regulator
MEDRLRKFAAVADAGSFTRAAAELRISQPALSTALGKLERELQTKLFVHGVRPLTLTPAGRLAYATAKELAVSAGNLQVRLAALANAGVRLRIGMIDSIASSVFANRTFVDQLGSQVTVSILVDNSRALMAAVERDEVDMAFIAGDHHSSATVQCRHVASEPLLAVCNSMHGDAYQTAALGGALPRFISYDQRSTTSQLIQEALHRQGIAAQTEVYSTSPEVMIRLVQLEQGVAVLPYTMVAPLVSPGGDIQVVVGVGIVARTIAVARRRDKQLPASGNRLVRQVRRALDAAMTEAEELVSVARA